MQSAVLSNATSLRASERRPTYPRLVGTDQVQAKPIAVSRCADFADVPDASGRLPVQGIRVLPAPRLRSVVLDLVANPADPVPAVRLDGFEPRTSEASVGDDDGLAAIGEDGLQGEEELPMRLGAVVALHRIDLFIDGDGPASHRHRGFDHEPASRRSASDQSTSSTGR